MRFRAVFSFFSRISTFACLVLMALVSGAPGRALGQNLPTDQILLFPLQGVRSIAYSPNGSTVVLGGQGGAKIHTLATGAETTLLTNAAGGNAAIYSPNGQTVALFGGGPLLLFSVSTGQLLTTISIPNTTIQSAAFSPDGTKIAVGGELTDLGGVLEIFSTSNYSMVESFPTVMFAVTTLAFSPDGNTLADSGAPSGPNEIELWNVSTGQLTNTLSTINLTGNNVVAFSPDGTMLAAAGGGITGTLEIFSVSTGTVIAKLDTAANYNVVSIAFSPDSKSLVDCGTALGVGNVQSPVVEIWNVPTGTLQHNLATSFTNAYFVTFSPDGSTVGLVGAGTNYSAELWNVSTDSLSSTINAGTPFSCPAVTYSADGSTVVAGEAAVIGGVNSFRVGLWNSTTGIQTQTCFSNANYSINSVALSPNGLTLASGGTSTIGGQTRSGVLEIWDPLIGGNAFELSTQLNYTVSSVAFSADGSLFADAGKSTSQGGLVEIWNFATGYRIATLPVAPYGSVSSISFSPDGKTIAVAGTNSSAGFLAIWDIATSSLVTNFTTIATAAVNSVAFSPDGKYLADCGTQNGTFGPFSATYSVLELWNVSTGFYVWTPQVSPGGSPTVVTYSPDGKVLFVSNGQLIAYSAVYGGAILYQKNFGAPGAIAVSPNGSQVAIAGGPLVLFGNTLENAVPISSLTLNPSTVLSGQSASATITLSSPAPSGGLTVLITETNTALTLPSAVTIPAGSTTATFSIATSSENTATTYPISVSDSSNSVTTSLTVTPPVVASLSVNPTSVLGGGTATGTVTLNAPAAYESGTVIYLTSSNSAVTPPSSVHIASGGTTATFSISTSGVASTTTASITATANGSSQSSNLTVTAASLTGMSVAPNGVNGGASATGTVTLSGPAGASGTVVNLTSSDLSTTVPSTVTVPSGATSATFNVTTVGVATTTRVTLTASFGNTTKTALFVVNGVQLHYVTVSPSSVTGGAVTSGSVTLLSPAPPSGISVSLASSGSAATVQASVTVPGGATTVTFPITTIPVSNTVTLNISATLGAATKSYSLIVAQPSLAAIALSPNNLQGGTSSTGTVTLNGPAPSNGATVTLSSDNVNAIVPPSVTIPAGLTATTFAITTVPVTGATTANISGTFVNTKSKSLVINSPALASFSISPTNLYGGASSTGTVTISSPAPTSGMTISLASSNASVIPPTSVVVTAGLTSATFPISTLPVSAQVAVTITASLGSTNISKAMTIYAAKLIGISMSPASVFGGATSVGTVTLNSPAGPGGDVVTLSSTNPALVLPPTVTVSSGATSATFNASTVGLTASTGITVSAVLGSNTVTCPFKINATVLHYINISPSSVTGGVTTTGSVFLSGVAPSGGLIVTLVSSNPAATVQASVTVPAGASTVTFPIVTTAVAATTTLSITASSGSVVTSYSLIIAAPNLAGITLSPSTVVGGASSTGTLLLSGPAPVGGWTVTLASSSTSATLPATIIIPAGASSATFPISTSAVTSNVTATISATANGITKSKPLTIS